MPRGLPKLVKDNLEKCQMAAVAAVESYNRPGRKFRTEQFLVMIIISWTALFHALFYRKNQKPWYKSNNGRYTRIDGEPKHWELSECLTKYFKGEESATRKNLEFLVGLRNKIEHRHLPELDVSLYGECQATLLNLEEMLVANFGEKYALTDELAISLQFSSISPKEKKAAARSLASSEARNVKEYIETFRGGLPSAVLNSMKYSFNVFLVPKVSNREKAADASVVFINVNEASAEELDRLMKLNVLIREKRIPIVNLDLFKPGQVVEKVNAESTYKMTLNSHAETWRYFGVRPRSTDENPQQTQADFCVYDEPHKDYLYTNAWVKRCIRAFNNRDRVQEITNRVPEEN